MVIHKAASWLLVAALLYACGPGHLLHPLLHEHLAAGHHHANRPAAGERILHARATQHHHHCAFCEFLAHFAADRPTPVIKPRAAFIPGTEQQVYYSLLVSTGGLGLPGSRSPPLISSVA
jgi:hypothetical protein